MHRLPDHKEIYSARAGPTDDIGADDRTLRGIETATAVLCRRWKPAILWLLAAGHCRYNTIAARLPGVTPKVLTDQLKELVHDGLVSRHEVIGGAKHVEYALTPIGESLGPLLELLDAWGRDLQRAPRHSPAIRERSVHSATDATAPRFRQPAIIPPPDTHTRNPRVDER